MFARTIRMQLKPNSAAEFTRMVEKDVLPLLRKQAGFKDQITFLPEGGKEAVAISLWEQKENAEAYHRETYAKVLKSVKKMVTGIPQIQTSEVSNSTWHNIAPVYLAERSDLNLRLGS